MRQIYKKIISRTEPATPTNNTFDDRIRAGQILIIRNLCATFENMATTEDARFFVQIGQEKFYIGGDLPDTTDGMAYWSGHVPVGEGEAVGVHTKASVATEKVTFWVIGELWEAEEWRKVNW